MKQNVQQWNRLHCCSEDAIVARLNELESNADIEKDPTAPDTWLYVI